MTARRPAVFLDRDGTINVDTGYVRRAEDVALVPGAAAGIARLNGAGIPVIVVTNQSGLGRGLISEAQYDAVAGRLAERLAEHGARIDATYLCPHDPTSTMCDCRKPGTLLFERAAAEHQLDLARSWFIGDRWRDLAPALVFGARAILIPSPHTHPHDVDQARAMDVAVAAGMEEAAGMVIQVSGVRMQGAGNDPLHPES